MIPIVLVVGGLVAVVAGWLVLRSIGPGVRVGRLIAATRVVPVAEAVRLAGSGSPRYVAVDGRVDAADPWEDEGGRPLVLRRQRLELRRGSRWEAFEDERRVVPFEIAEGLDRVAVDGRALDVGLVVVTRESVGTAGDLGDRVPPGTDPATPARLRLELLSAVDHALVLGVPVMDPARGATLAPGLGRPLVLTNVGAEDAMRILADGRQGTTRAASVLFAAGVVAIVAGTAWAIVGALA